MPNTSSKTGKLYVVATPIGNLADMSQRAIDVLSSVDVVAAEDTRHSRVLFNQFGINTRMVSLNEQNEGGRVAALLAMLEQGKDVALISDAGTPLVSDPGFLLVRAVREAGYEATPAPGPSAMIAALSVAGLPTDRFVFEGFLPAKSTARRKALTALLSESRTMVFYESVHRIVASLGDIVDVMGADRQLTVAREMTKKFETITHGAAASVLDALSARPDALKGEFVIVVEGRSSPDAGLADAEKLLMALLDELPAAQAARVAAKVTGAPRKALYQMALNKS